MNTTTDRLISVRNFRYEAPAVRQHHSRWTIVLHWASLLAIVALVGAVLAREIVEDKAWRAALLEAHRQLGLFVGLALVLRVLVRLTAGLADTTAGMAAWMRWAATLTHAALYGLLATLVGLGLALSNAHAVQVKLLGLLPLPLLVDEDSDLADTLADWHLWAAWALLAVVLLHAGAALYHHVVKRDGVLRAMLPGKHR